MDDLTDAVLSVQARRAGIIVFTRTHCGPMKSTAVPGLTTLLNPDALPAREIAVPGGVRAVRSPPRKCAHG